MIEQKTAVLLGASMEMGGIVAKASEEENSLLYEFGKNLGIAFQLQDDYLDVFGDPETFGKQVGGDIIANKKTYLYLMALKKGSPDHQKELAHLFSISPSDSRDKIKRVEEIFVESGSAEATSLAIENYSNKAFAIIDKMNVSDQKKALFIKFGQDLMERKF